MKVVVEGEPGQYPHNPTLGLHHQPGRIQETLERYRDDRGRDDDYSPKRSRSYSRSVSPGGTKDDRRSPRAKDDRRSPRAKDDRRSPRAKEDRRSPHAKDYRRSPRAKENGHSPNDKKDRAPSRSPSPRGNDRSPSRSRSRSYSPR